MKPFQMRNLELNELFEEMRATSELTDTPSGYVQMFVAEYSQPAKIVIGRPKAWVWSAWGEFTERGDGPQIYPIASMIPVPRMGTGLLWLASDKAGKYQALIATTPELTIPQPPGLEGWDTRTNTLSHLIAWEL